MTEEPRTDLHDERATLATLLSANAELVVGVLRPGKAHRRFRCSPPSARRAISAISSTTSCTRWPGRPARKVTRGPNSAICSAPRAKPPTSGSADRCRRPGPSRRRRTSHRDRTVTPAGRGNSRYHRFRRDRRIPRGRAGRITRRFLGLPYLPEHRDIRPRPARRHPADRRITLPHHSFRHRRHPRDNPGSGRLTWIARRPRTSTREAGDSRARPIAGRSHHRSDRYRNCGNDRVHHLRKGVTGSAGTF